MAKDNKKMVDAITSMDEDFAKWYTDICKKAGTEGMYRRAPQRHPYGAALERFFREGKALRRGGTKARPGTGAVCTARGLYPG